MANDLIYSDVAGKGSFADKASMRARRRMYETLAKRIALDEMRTILDVGVTADQSNIASNFFEKFYPHPERITALSDQDASWMETVWPGLAFIQGNVLTTPNRLYPVEFHTGLSFIHYWLPKSAHHALLNILGKSFFASEEHLNLLAANDLPGLHTAAGANAAKTEMQFVRFGGFVSNLLLLTKDTEHDAG